MPIWAAMISKILFGMAFLVFVHAFYFQMKIIFIFPMRTMIDYQRLQKGPWSDRELELRTKWLRAIAYVAMAFGIILVWAFLISIGGLNGPLDCALSEGDFAFLLNKLLMGLICASNV